MPNPASPPPPSRCLCPCPARFIITSWGPLTRVKTLLFSTPFPRTYLGDNTFPLLSILYHTKILLSNPDLFRSTLKRWKEDSILDQCNAILAVILESVKAKKYFNIYQVRVSLNCVLLTPPIDHNPSSIQC